MLSVATTAIENKNYVMYACMYIYVWRKCYLFALLSLSLLPSLSLFLLLLGKNHFRFNVISVVILGQDMVTDEVSLKGLSRTAPILLVRKDSAVSFSQHGLQRIDFATGL